MELNLEQLQAVIETSQFDNWLGLKAVRLDEQSLTIRMPARNEITGIPKIQILHGGAISTLVDATACYLLIALRNKRVSTIDMTIDYLRPAFGEMTATSRLIRLGRTVCVVSVEVVDSRNKLIAVGRLAIVPLEVPVGQEEQLLGRTAKNP